ncbi:hypothetical protein E2C01_066896 [Portunus trituberculatus]|uniref:Uncharacterized protein n=1 Tax=Portunus trituberculatus TaxID=210409 RepID=A0A5B7HVZ9_PORTR|nr:hypothetical protein [Portunus trituberculatus]
MKVLVSHIPPLVGSQELVFMDGDLSSDDLPPPPHPSSLLFYIIHLQPSLTVPPTGKGKMPEAPLPWKILRRDWRNRIRYRYEIVIRGAQQRKIR